MNAYVEMKNRHQAEYDAFPLHFAFGQEQIDRKLKELGLTKKNYQDHITGIGFGGFILNKDVPAYKEMLNRHHRERMEAREADKDGTGYLFQMFHYELQNHEFGYTGDVTETLMALGITEKQIEANPAYKAALEKAVAAIWEYENSKDEEEKEDA